ncbi:MAG: GDSL-type esterase/lipase family protein [Bacteroidales bacterium]|nr:GDSL-type esterase/lipase family protein [Bacteroidales bacterium]
MRKLFLICSLLLVAIVAGAQERPVKVACVGNSVTYGYTLANRETDCYPSVLQRMLGPGYEVANFGHSARTLMHSGNLPYTAEATYQNALAFAPDIVIIMLGTNDTKPDNWAHAEDFVPDLQAMIADFQLLESKPRVILCTPATVFRADGEGINETTLANGVIPAIKEVASTLDLPLIDIHTLTGEMGDHFPDGIHPDPIGARTIATAVYTAITL